MDHQPLPATALDAAGSIAVDLSCLNCGYNLRGLDPNGCCPECGVAIGRSVHGDLLRFCSPRWVRRIAQGINLLILGLVLCVLCSIFRFMTSSGGLAVMSLCYLLCWAGAWYFTTADPSQIEPRKDLWLRSFVRYGPLAVLLADFLSYAVFPTVRPGFPGATGSLILARAATGAIGLLGLISVLLYLLKLVQRIPDESLGRRVYAATVILGIVGALCVFLPLVASVATRTTPFAFPAGAALILVLVIPRVGVLRVLSRGAMGLLEAASQAEKSWSAEPT